MWQQYRLLAEQGQGRILIAVYSTGMEYQQSAAKADSHPVWTALPRTQMPISRWREQREQPGRELPYPVSHPSSTGTLGK